MSRGFATFLAVKVQRNTSVQLHAGQYGTAMCIDDQGFTHFGKLRTFQTGDQDWQCGWHSRTAPERRGAICVLHVSLPCAARNRCRSAWRGPTANVRPTLTPQRHLVDQSEVLGWGCPSDGVASTLGNWRERTRNRPHFSGFEAMKTQASPPPSTRSAAPVIQFDMGLARNRTALATSSGVPTRARGRLAASFLKTCASSPSCPHSLRSRGVSTSPGQTQFTWMLCLP